jgi:pyruvate/2-oxoglutarate dehydrogenase complex dihydrolipoamide dehydrogenase (E3) component
MLMSNPAANATSSPAEREPIIADLCILGAGPGGLALAASAAAYGQKVVLIEKHKMGGTSLNYGAMPVTALLACAERAHAFRSAAPFGITPFEPGIDRAAVQAQIADIMEKSAPNASVERMTGLNVRVIQAAGRFVDAKTVIAGEHKIAARRFVIATGSSPLVPAIPGLANIAHYTTDTVQTARGTIDHLIIVGGGATGVEYAQAYRRLGSRVTLIEQAKVLQRFDPELAAVIKARLVAEGVVIIEDARLAKVEGAGERLRFDVLAEGGRSRVEGSHLLLSCGRQPVIADIGLDAAKVAVTDQGIKVNRYLRTSNRRVFAIGDVTGLPHSTQRAEYHARLLVNTLLFRSAKPVNPRLIPASIHTDPEFATVGLAEAEARNSYSSIQVFRWPLRENARALANRMPMGHIKVIADRSGKIIGAGIVSRSAAELIGVWALAISKGLSLEDMSDIIMPFPSLGDISVKVSSQRSTALAGNAISRRWVKFLTKLG